LVRRSASPARAAPIAFRSIATSAATRPVVVFSSLPDDSLHIYAGLLLDAVKRAQARADTVEPGHLREIRQVDPNTNHVTKTFIGPESFVRDFTVVRGKARIVHPDTIALRGQKRTFGGLWS
jgi:hypothetical protein